MTDNKLIELLDHLKADDDNNKNSDVFYFTASLYNYYISFSINTSLEIEIFEVCKKEFNAWEWIEYEFTDTQLDIIANKCTEFNAKNL